MKTPRGFEDAAYQLRGNADVGKIAKARLAKGGVELARQGLLARPGETDDRECLEESHLRPVYRPVPQQATIAPECPLTAGRLALQVALATAEP